LYFFRSARYAVTFSCAPRTGYLPFPDPDPEKEFADPEDEFAKDAADPEDEFIKEFADPEDEFIKEVADPEEESIADPDPELIDVLLPITIYFLLKKYMVFIWIHFRYYF
jgi:hypothetical protein